MYKKIERIIQEGGVGIFPTDTLYGLVGSALNPKAVRRVYQLRKRNSKKPLIVLIGSERDLSLFQVKPSATVKQIIGKLWPGPISIILSCNKKKFKYLHCGTKTLAFRVPKGATLRHLLKRTGPLVAPSANPEGEKPATTITQAKQYFGNKIDFYKDSGKLDNFPSTIIEIKR